MSSLSPSRHLFLVGRHCRGQKAACSWVWVGGSDSAPEGTNKGRTRLSFQASHLVFMERAQDIAVIRRSLCPPGYGQ
eukprot:1329998-Amphidinium_carterae.1